MNVNDALQMVFPLADATQLRLFVCRDKEDLPLYIKGYGDMACPISDTLEFTMMCVVKASGVNPHNAYIIVHVQGDLHVLLSYDSHMKEVTFALLDGKPMEDLNNRNLKHVFDTCLPSIKAMWIKAENNSNWSRLDAPEGMDEPTPASSEEAGGTADPVSINT